MNDPLRPWIRTRMLSVVAAQGAHAETALGQSAHTGQHRETNHRFDPRTNTALNPWGRDPDPRRLISLVSVALDPRKGARVNKSWPVRIRSLLPLKSHLQTALPEGQEPSKFFFFFGASARTETAGGLFIAGFLRGPQ
jgi:hypothetical protein